MHQDHRAQAIAPSVKAARSSGFLTFLALEVRQARDDLQVVLPAMMHLAQQRLLFRERVLQRRLGETSDVTSCAVPRDRSGIPSGRKSVSHRSST